MLPSPHGRGAGGEVGFGGGTSSPHAKKLHFDRLSKGLSNPTGTSMEGGRDFGGGIFEDFGAKFKASQQSLDGNALNLYKSGQFADEIFPCCLLYTSPSPRDRQKSRMPSSA